MLKEARNASVLRRLAEPEPIAGSSRRLSRLHPGTAATGPASATGGAACRQCSPRADLALGRLAGSIETLPNPDLFVLMYVRKEAVLSSQIEGTQSSLQDLLAAEAQVFDPEQPRDVAEVLNYVAAMNHGLERLASLPVSVRLIREIHAELLARVRGLI